MRFYSRRKSLPVQYAVVHRESTRCPVVSKIIKSLTLWPHVGYIPPFLQRPALQGAKYRLFWHSWQRTVLFTDKGASSGKSVLITEYRLTTKPTTNKGYRINSKYTGQSVGIITPWVLLRTIFLLQTHIEIWHYRYPTVPTASVTWQILNKICVSRVLKNSHNKQLKYESKFHPKRRHESPVRR